MVKFFVYALSIILLLSLNIVFPTIYGGAPNLLFLFVIFYAFKQDQPDFLWLAFFSGLFLDFLSSGFFGTYTITFLVISFVINYTTRTFFTADPSVEFMASVIGISFLFLVGSIYFFNSVAYNLNWVSQGASPLYLTSKMWMDLLLDLIFAIPVYFLTIFNDKIILKSENKSLNLQ